MLNTAVIFYPPKHLAKEEEDSSGTRLLSRPGLENCSVALVKRHRCIDHVPKLVYSSIRNGVLSSQFCGPDHDPVLVDAFASESRHVHTDSVDNLETNT